MESISICVGEHYANLPECPQDPWTVNADVWPLLGLSGGIFFNWNDLSRTTQSRTPCRPCLIQVVLSYKTDLYLMLGSMFGISDLYVGTLKRHLSRASLHGGDTLLQSLWSVFHSECLPTLPSQCEPLMWSKGIPSEVGWINTHFLSLWSSFFASRGGRSGPRIARFYNI